MLTFKGSAGETSSNGGTNDDVPNNFEAFSKYNAFSRIKITDITSNEINQEILQRLKDNDGSFDKLRILHPPYPWVGTSDNNDYYTIIDGEDIVWLGYYIGQNTKLRELHFYSKTIDNELFYKELSRNSSINKVVYVDFTNYLLDGETFRMMVPFFKNNNSLNCLEVSEYTMSADCLRQLALAIAECNTSLNEVVFSSNQIGSENIVDIITALSMHPQLNRIVLDGMNIGRNPCTALSTLLRCSTTNLQSLSLNDNDIDDDGIKSLSQSIRGSKLQELNLAGNRSISTRGWKAVSSLLATPNCCLERLDISDNNIGDDEALLFADALASNSSLRYLDLTGDDMTIRHEDFTVILCDESSINKTYLSNHTFQGGNRICYTRSRDFQLILELNAYENKDQVAMSKIVWQHTHFDVQPFFEWEFKVLPLMIEWFTKASKASECIQDFVKQRRNRNGHSRYSPRLNLGSAFPEGKLERMKLSVVYDFIREFPMLYIEPVTRQKIAELNAIEEQLQGNPLWGEKLEEIRKRKARAMRRL